MKKLINKTVEFYTMRKRKEDSLISDEPDWSSDGFMKGINIITLVVAGFAIAISVISIIVASSADPAVDSLKADFESYKTDTDALKTDVDSLESDRDDISSGMDDQSAIIDGIIADISDYGVYNFMDMISTLENRTSDISGFLNQTSDNVGNLTERTDLIENQTYSIMNQLYNITSACDSVTCPDICSSDIRMYNGTCVAGVCVYNRLENCHALNTTCNAGICG